MKWCNEDHFVSFLELQKEKKILQEHIVSAGIMSEENTKQINNLEKEKEHLLSELVQSASHWEKEIKMMREAYENHLVKVADGRTKDVLETSRVNMRLKEQLQSIISEKEHNIAQITIEKYSLKADLKKAADAQKTLIKHNQSLIAHVMKMESESAYQKLQLQELNEQREKKVHFKDIFADLEHRIVNLELKQEEIAADKNVQLERIDTIAEQLSNLDVEAQQLHCERKDVAAIRDMQENKLAQTVGRLMSLKECSKDNYLMVDGTLEDSSVESLEAAVSELKAFVESSKMRISDIDQRIKEVEEDKSVLMQQQSDALERKNEYVNC
jgi:hypothetical protein